jgi:DNA-binding NtrC family response regulator
MQTNEQLSCEAASLRTFHEFFGSPKVLRQELKYLRNAASSKLTILITGESGTGKELAACAVHQLSHRSPRAFVRIHCAEIQPQLVAFELFGQRKDRRSPQAQPRLDYLPLAEGGTIFFAGVDDPGAEAQLGLLRVLRDLESVHLARNRAPQLIAGTRRDLQAATAAGTFHRSLFFRLIPWKSVQVRTSPGSASGMPLPNETELLEAALLEMVAALPGWEPPNLPE